MGLKEQKRPNTLMEYMGFKDEDLNTNTHDEIVCLVSKKENLIKIIKKLDYRFNNLDEITIEKVLSDKYKEYGFLDIYFRYYRDNFDSPIGFIEVKTKEQSFGSLVREIEYYKNIIKKLNLGFNEGRFIPIYIGPTQIPEHIKQFHSFTLEQIKEILQ